MNYNAPLIMHPGVIMALQSSQAPAAVAACVGWQASCAAEWSRHAPDLATTHPGLGLLPIQQRK